MEDSFLSSPWIYEFLTKSGLQVRVRPVRPEDAPELVDLFEHLSPHSRYRRFNPDPDEVLRESERLAGVSSEEGAAWLAVADLPDEPDCPIAVTRYQLIPPDTAEAAIAVRDDVQGQGVGTQLLLFVAGQAQLAGIDKLVALVQHDNVAIASLFKYSPYPIKQLARGEYIYVEADLR
jgi:acetyltransferase